MNNPETMHQPEARFYLSEEQKEQFHQQGFIGPFTLYQPDEMKALWRKARLQLLDRSHAVYQPDAAVSGSTNISNYDRHLDLDFLAEHICRREIVDLLADRVLSQAPGRRRNRLASGRHVCQRVWHASDPLA
jgi:chlorinating enzyme